LHNFGDAPTEGNFGSVGSGSFTGIPSCPTPEVPAATTGKHGQCVSGPAHAGIRGNGLAAIAKDNTRVGEYGSATCPWSPSELTR